MPDNVNGQLPHILLSGTATNEPYTSTATRGRTFIPPPRNRDSHGLQLKRQFDRIGRQFISGVEEQKAYGNQARNGVYLEFESCERFELKIESLEARQSGIELLSAKVIGEKTHATVFVPDGKLDILTKKLDSYLDPENDSDKGKPKNNDLIASIESIKRAALEAIWTDSEELLPIDDEVIWWEAWLRAGDDPDGDLAFFKEHARRIQLEVNDEVLKFPDRTIVAVKGNKSQMSKSIKLLNCIAELRRVKDRADFFSIMPRGEQFDWITDAIDLIEPPSSSQPAVCILDTGINYSHPLLVPVIDPSDLDACNPSWNVTDHNGHGTEMAGLAAFGDLTNLLSFSSPINLTHSIESVKILPPHGYNDPQLYGSITSEAVYRAEVNQPYRNRNFCMAVTTTDYRDAGRPSSWSASIDSLCSGTLNNDQRLIIISAGNTIPTERHHYPNNNMTEGIHDPGQAWNALTVGAYTEKNHIEPSEFPDWELIAQPGDLSPSSCTSMDWSRPWPLKPDFVMEGGNMARNPVGSADYIDSLGLLSTNWMYDLMQPLTISGDTSAATALAAKLAAQIQSQYPEYWPETVRALLLHSSQWSEAMLDRFAPLRNKSEYERLIRYCGYGVPSIERALWSASNSLTLIAQDTLQPFDKVRSAGKTKDMSVHNIPWPAETLEALGNTNVEMRVTLSYFIEPNPARRGWGKKYSYASHGLRFDVKRPLESIEDFKQRINKAARDEDRGRDSTSPPSDGDWVLGSRLRKLGSVHSDIWTGTAIELANRGHLAVYPVMGWWRTNLRHNRWSQKARYSLIITIKTPEVDIDLYTPVKNMIRQPIAIQV